MRRRHELSEEISELPRLRRLREVAEHLGLSDRTLYQRARAGDFGYYMLGGVIFVDVQEIQAWLRAQYRAPHASDHKASSLPGEQEEPSSEPS